MIDYYQPLFDLMANEHDLILLESDMDQIIDTVFEMGKQDQSCVHLMDGLILDDNTGFDHHGNQLPTPWDYKIMWGKTWSELISLGVAEHHIREAIDRHIETQINSDLLKLAWGV